MAPCVTACGRTATESFVPGQSDGVEILPGSIRIELARVPQLTKAGGFLVVAPVNVIVIQSGSDEYRAFTNVCTHAGCGISGFVHPRIKCQCHGSEFDLEGRNVEGPAPLPLTRYATTRDDLRFLVIVLR